MTKSFLKAASIVAFSIMALYALVLVPIYEIVSCDIMLMDTLLFDAIDLFMQWTEIFALILVLAFLLIGVEKAGNANDCRSLFLLLGGAFLFKYVGAVLALSVVHGSLDVTLNYGSYIISLLLELIPCALLIFLTHKYVVTQAKLKKEREHAALILGQEPKSEPMPLPFTKFFDRENPLQKIVYIIIGMIAGIRALSFIASEIAYSMLGFTYHISDLPITLLYLFLLVLLPCFIGYFILYATVKFTLRSPHKKTK
ncbi:MAG: hypothetical protein IKB41_01010 [Clostridia bacterium]|nr:hypothetical protein [Clostridia bacterium]